MNRVIVALSLLSLSAASARAQKPDTKAAAPAGAKAPAPAEPPAPPKPGDETKALTPLAKSFTTSGTVKANAMGPGSPELPAKGKHTCKWMTGNLWLVCDVEDTSGAGPKAVKWVGHIQMGWDFEAKTYRATVVDNFGSAGLMQGKLDGSKLVLESASEMSMMGQPMKIRISYDWADGKAIKFSDERMFGKAPWVLFEDGVLKAAGK